MKYVVRYIDGQGQDRWTRLPVKTAGRGRKVQIVKAMHRIFGKHVTILEIAVSK